MNNSHSAPTATPSATPTRWSKSHPAWGSARRIQRNAYAYAVTMVMTGGRMECPACEGALDIDTAEVDRAIPANDYCEGNIVYLCRACNQSRSILQSAGEDWTHIGQYVSDIASASAHVTVPTMAEARAWWSDRPAGVARISRYA